MRPFDKMMKNSKKGFTLVELIMVLAVLGILAVIAVPKLIGVKEDAILKADKITANNIGKSAEMYIQMNGIPESETLADGSKGKDEKGILVDEKYVGASDLNAQYEGKHFKITFTVNDKGEKIVMVKYSEGGKLLYKTGINNVKE
ncbi:type II secretion system protein [Clostridiisalibacter paucivorans]|uniref:type II secretion system protein n=1 Tax=Clostridiisalibacter paucivorans TaxID=408753 RepID=UPI000553892E|nr:type II secretion system protein [Clostridiisalibacter paucivorans]